VSDHLSGISFIPAPIEVLGGYSELNHKIAGQVFRLNLSALFPPQPIQRLFVIAHDDPGIRTADETAAINGFDAEPELVPRSPAGQQAEYLSTLEKKHDQ